MAAESSSAPEFNGTFAELIPKNQAAKDLFSLAVVRMERDQDRFHLQFVSCTAAEESFLEKTTEPIETDTEYDTHDTAEELHPERSERPNHSILSFEKGPTLPNQGWRVGKGTTKTENRKVEFLLAPPGHRQSRHLANVHLFFRFNRKSGMLMLVAGSEKVSVRYQTGGVWKELLYPSEKLLYQTATTLRLGPFDYELVYTIQDAQRADYFSERNEFFKASSSEALPPGHLQKLHMDQYMLIRDILVFETKGCGSFGWVNIAIDTNTGNPLAMKELRITNKVAADDFLHEVAFGEQFGDQVGLVSFTASWCEHNKDKPCGIIPEKAYICMPLAQTDFSRSFWAVPSMNIQTKMKLLKDTLQGLCTMHNQGAMHRDITMKNMLILSTQPPQAVICDYGKATSEEQPTSTLIGPVGTLAPEVWNGSAYSNKIDLWAWAYAVAEILGYYHSGNHKITVERMAGIHSHLTSYSAAATVPEEKHLVKLSLKLLAWNPDKRISAKEALLHPCWDKLDEPSESSHEAFETVDKQSKRPRTKG